MYTTLPIHFVTVLTLLGGGEALAASCYGTTIDQQACDTDATDGSTAEDICMVTGGGAFIDCYLDRIGSSSASGGTLNARMVSGRFELSGQDWNGNDFCCLRSMPSNNLTIRLFGSSNDDTFDLDDATWPLAAGPTYSVQAVVRGDDGDDTITGSSEDSALYSESLFGDADSDEIEGEAGDDVIYGGGGEDVCYGGDGDDEIFGDADDDYLYGEDGQDELWGGDNDDYLDGGADRDSLHGGADNDELYGGYGDDVLCGDAETYPTGSDYLDGEDGDDTLWGVYQNSCQTPYCAGNQNTGDGTADDYCDGWSVGTNPYGSTCTKIYWAPQECLY